MKAARVFKIKVFLSQFNYLVRIKNKRKCLFFLQFISVSYGSDTLQFNLKKSLNMDLKNTGLVLTLRDIGFGIEKYWDSLLDSK